LAADFAVPSPVREARTGLIIVNAVVVCQSETKPRNSASTAMIKPTAPLVLFLMQTLLATAANAQDAGRPRQGLAIARDLCSECHAVEPSQPLSPDGRAPRFDAIAMTPGMTATALTAALQTSHRAMPNIILDSDQKAHIIAYIMSLRR
jgi:mono/diheme cytochrome c family protein